MSYHLYQQTMQQLSRTLSHQLGAGVSYSHLVHSDHKDKKWLKKENSTVIPLFFRYQPAGLITIESGGVGEDTLDQVYHLIQWTLVSLEDVFKQYNTDIYSGADIYPLLIESLDSKDSIKKACDLYETSQAKSFIHYHAKAWNESIFSEDLDKTFIFISDLSELSKENQLFLAHFLRTKKAQPFIAASIGCPLNEANIAPSLQQAFASRWSSAKNGLVRL